MKLLLDQGLPRSTVVHLRKQGIEAAHVGDKGLATASDSTILECGRQEGMVVVTLDADFHALLALSGLTGPSVIRIRIEGLRGEGPRPAAGHRPADLQRGRAERGNGFCN
jgi:predicted nuclease of predicted toxin-antitoxin system